MTDYLILLSNIILLLIPFMLSLITTRKLVRDMFEPINFFLIFFGMFVLMNNIVNFNNNISSYSSLIIILGTLFLYIGYYSKEYYIGINLKEDINRKLFKIVLIITILGPYLLLLYRLNKYNVSILDYYSNILIFHATNIKSGGYYTYPLQALINLSTILCYIYIWKTYKFRRALICNSIIMILIIIPTFQGSRWPIISMFLMQIAIYHYTVSKINFNIFKAFVFGIFTIISLYYLNQFRLYGFSHIPKFDLSIIFQSFVGDTKPLRLFERLVAYLHSTNDYFGFKYFLFQLVTFIPRGLWSSKPITSFDFSYTVKLGNNPLKLETYTFMFYGDFYASFGLITLLIGSFIFGRIIRSVYAKINNEFLLAFYLKWNLNLINIFRGGFIDMIPFFIVDSIVLLILYILNKFLRKGIVKTREHNSVKEENDITLSLK